MERLFKELSKRKVIVLHETDSVFQAARAMLENDIGSIVVADHRGYLVGMLTDRDLVCNIISNQKDWTTPISQAMSRGLIWAREQARIENIISLMKEFGIRRVPLVSVTPKKLEKCVGIVTFDDLVTFKLATPQQLSEILQAQNISPMRKLESAAGFWSQEAMRGTFTMAPPIH